MLTPKCYITIVTKDGEMNFNGCHQLVISRSVEELSATGTLHLPAMGLFDSKTRNILAVREKVAAGNPITIYAGYEEHDYYELFNGYVKTVNTGTTVKLELEEHIYELRKYPVKLSILEDDEGDKQSLKYILEEITKDTDFTISAQCADMTIKKFQHNGNAAGALAKLKQMFYLTVHVNKYKEVYAGLEPGKMLSPEEREQATINVTYGKNIIRNDVEYHTKDSKPLKVYVKCVDKDAETGKEREQGEAGIDGGEEQTYLEYNLTDKKELDEKAEQIYKMQSYDGFSGTITLFGIPYALPGGTVVYKNENYNDTEGKYHIKAVETSLGTNGLRQTLTLGYKYDENN